MKGIKNYRVAVMCAEENPVKCHRRLLVARMLAKRGVRIQHIRADGTVQDEGELARTEDQGKDKQAQLNLFEKTRE